MPGRGCWSWSICASSRVGQRRMRDKTRTIPTMVVSDAERLYRRPFAVTHRGVLAIAVPMTLAYLTTPLVGVVNLGVVGQLGDPALVGGVSIGALIFDIVFVDLQFPALRARPASSPRRVGADDRREIAAMLLARAGPRRSSSALRSSPCRRRCVALALRLIGGSDAVQAATRAYWRDPRPRGAVRARQLRHPRLADRPRARRLRPAPADSC